MIKKQMLTVSLMLVGTTSFYAMENPVGKYGQAKQYLKQHFNSIMANCDLENAEILCLGQIHVPEVYSNISSLVNILATDDNTTFLVEGSKKGKRIVASDYTQWKDIKDTVVTKGSDLSIEQLKAMHEAILKKAAEAIALLRAGKQPESFIFHNEDEIIRKRNKEFISGIKDELTSGKKVIVTFGQEHYSKLPEAQELQDFFNSKKTCVYFPIVTQTIQEQKDKKMNAKLIEGIKRLGLS